MVVKLSTASQLKFFYDVLGQEVTNGWIKPLVDAGVVLNVEFTRVTAQVKGNQHVLDLPVSTTSLMKGKADPALSNKAKTLIAEWITLLRKMMGLSDLTFTAAPTWGAAGASIPLGGFGGGGGSGNTENWTVIAAGGGGAGASGGASGFSGAPSIVSVKVLEPDHLQELADATGLPASVVADLKAKIGGLQSIATPIPSGGSDVPFIQEPFVPKEELSAGFEPPKPAVKKTKKSVGTIATIPLRDATDVGQRVRGTDGGSVYTAVAISPNVNLAVRVLGAKISIRAEFKGKHYQDEKDKLSALGLTAATNSVTGGEYMSAHMQADDCPAGRVVGAFLFDCGIDFTQQMHNFKGLQHGDHK